MGCSILYHLAKLGWTDSVLVEQYQLTHGSTWHSRRARRPAALVDLADADDAVLGRALRRAEGADGQRPGLAPARRAAARLVAAAPRGDPPPGGVGEDVRPADGDRVSAQEAQELFPPMSTDGVRRRGVHPRRRLPRPEPADVLARRRARARSARRSSRARRVTGIETRDGRVIAVETDKGRDRVRGRRRRRRHVRAGGRAARRRRPADHPVRPPVPDHRAVRPAARAAADAARPRQPRLLPHRGRRARDGRLRAQAARRGRSTASRRASRRSSCRRSGTAWRSSSRTRSRACRRWRAPR